MTKSHLDKKKERLSWCLLLPAEMRGEKRKEERKREKRRERRGEERGEEKRGEKRGQKRGNSWWIHMAPLFTRNAINHPDKQA